MKRFLSIFILFFTLQSYSQIPVYKQGCTFLKDLHFKNGVDTITILAYKNASVRMPPYDNNLEKLNHAKKLNSKDFNYTVDFKVLDCSDRYIIACKDTSDFASKVNGNNYHKVVQLRCIVFEGYFEFSRPYFIIDRVTAYKE